MVLWDRLHELSNQQTTFTLSCLLYLIAELAGHFQKFYSGDVLIGHVIWLLMASASESMSPNLKEYPYRSYHIAAPHLLSLPFNRSIQLRMEYRYFVNVVTQKTFFEDHCKYHNPWRTSQLFKPEKKKLYKTQEWLIRQSRNPNLYPWVVSQWNTTPNNRFTPLTKTPEECHKLFEHKLVFGENIL